MRICLLLVAGLLALPLVSPAYDASLAGAPAFDKPRSQAKPSKTATVRSKTVSSAPKTKAKSSVKKDGSNLGSVERQALLKNRQTPQSKTAQVKKPAATKPVVPP